MKHEDLTRRIIAAAMKVHSTLGNGFQEVIYQRAMAIEMPFHNLTFEREKEMSIYYREIEIGTRRVDFFVEKLIMVELKAVIQLEDVHHQELLGRDLNASSLACTPEGCEGGMLRLCSSWAYRLSGKRAAETKQDSTQMG